MKTKQVFNNAKWIIVCKIVQSVLQLIIGMITARYLGPSNYGLINYANSIVAFALPFMKLGMDAILVHELVESPEHEGEIMGTSLLLNVVSGVVCIFGVSAFSYFFNMGEKDTIIVCILYSISILFAAIEMVQYWFQYKLLSKYSSVVMLIAYFLVSVYKIYLLISAKNVYWFAVSHSVEYSIVGALLLFLYKKNGGKSLSFSWERAKRMFSKSKHYILAALMVIVIQNTDHIMLTSMVGKVENGYYSAAITSAGVAQFVFTAIIDSFRPVILSSKKSDAFEYENNISRLYGIIIYLSLAQSLLFTIFAPLIINLLYGFEYSAAIPVLQILTWYRAFSFMGSIRNIWLLGECKQNYLPAINFVGVTINIILNAVMIPFWKACGAAVASLITQILMNFMLGFLLKSIRTNNYLLLKGINPQYMLKQFKIFVQEMRAKK